MVAPQIRNPPVGDCVGIGGSHCWNCLSLQLVFQREFQFVSFFWGKVDKNNLNTVDKTVSSGTQRPAWSIWQRSDWASAVGCLAFGLSSFTGTVNIGHKEDRVVSRAQSKPRTTLIQKLS